MPLETNKINLQSILSRVSNLSSPRYSSLSLVPSTISSAFTPASEYNGYDQITLSAVTSNIDSNILSSNIKSGINILGCTGNLEGGANTWNDYLNGKLSTYVGSQSTIGSCAFQCYYSLATVSFPNCTYIENYAFQGCYSLTTISFPICSRIGSYAFQNCSSLTTASFPNCSYIGSSAFCYCYSLTTASFPNCSYIGSYAFQNCSSLTTISFPNCSRIEKYAFQNCISLTTVSFPNCNYIRDYTFRYCSRLISLYLLSTSVCSLPYSDAFSSTPIGGYSTVAGQYGSIYVPASLLTSYKAATNWIYFSSRFVGV